MKSELVEQVITVKPYCSEGHAHVCCAVQPASLLPDDVCVVEQDNCVQEEAAVVSV